MLHFSKHNKNVETNGGSKKPQEVPKPTESLPAIPKTGLKNEELMILLKLPSSTFYAYKKIARIPKGRSLNNWQHIYRFYRAYRWAKVQREVQKSKPSGTKTRTYLRDLQTILKEEATNRNQIKDPQQKNSYDLLAQDLKEKGVDIIAEFKSFRDRAMYKIQLYRQSQSYKKTKSNYQFTLNKK